MQVSLDTSIYDLNRLGVLSVRALNILDKAEILTLRQVLQVDLTQIAKFQNCGNKTIIEIRGIQERYRNVFYGNELDEELKEKLEIDISTWSEKKIYLLSSWMHTRYKKLSKRAKKNIVNYDKVEIVLPLISSENILAYNISKEVRKEIRHYLKDVETFLGRIK